MIIHSGSMLYVSIILVHSDIRGFSQAKSQPNAFDINYKQQLINQAFKELEQISLGREILIPTFNYDFTSTKKYDVLEDLPQVGRIPVATIGKSGWYRCTTPVYSFASNKKVPDQYPRPFSNDSAFNRLIEEDGEILLIGVGFERFTFVHYVEHVFGIPYRYEKQFKGELLQGNMSVDIDVNFHVRPKGLNIEYDFERIKDIHFEYQAARWINPNQIAVDARKSLSCLIEVLTDNPLWLLTKESEQKVREKLDRLGRKFKLEDFE